MSGASPTTAGTLRPSAFPLSHPQCCELNCVPERYVDVLTPGTAEWPCLETGRSETGLVTMMSSRQGRPRSQCDWCSRKRPQDRHKEKRPRGEAGGERGGAATQRGCRGRQEPRRARDDCPPEPQRQRGSAAALMSVTRGVALSCAAAGSPDIYHMPVRWLQSGCSVSSLTPAFKGGTRESEGQRNPPAQSPFLSKSLPDVPSKSP